MVDGRNYRVFICYAHQNRAALRKVVSCLKKLGLCPYWSGTLRAGTPFSHQIEEGISRAHLFLPILTSESNERSWVQQEIGFALASNVPVLPLALGDAPGGLAHGIQAIKVERDLSDLKKKLTRREIDAALSAAIGRGGAYFEVAPLMEDRTRMLFSAAEWLSRNRQFARVRQWGAFTSFSLPDADYRSNVWRRSDGCGKTCNYGTRRDMQRERQALERHARKAGCDLLIHPDAVPGSGSKKRARIRTLIEFLKSMPDRKVRAVVLGEDEPARGNLLLLGDWFLAESITPLPGLGYKQTLGTWHAPTILSRLAEFKRLFKTHFRQARVKGVSSRQAAIDQLKALL